MNLDLFNSQQVGQTQLTEFAPQACLLAGYATAQENEIKALLKQIIQQSPLRQMKTPAGQRMQVSMTSCGDYGWISDAKGYRYVSLDPLTQQAWPAMPETFRALAREAAELAGFNNFNPDSCLINCYRIGARLSLHQDKDEKDFSQPIVSISFGLPATFVFSGLKRTDAKCRMQLMHGDVVVWGGESRLAYHGVLPLQTGRHELFQACRINLTFRKSQ